MQIEHWKPPPYDADSARLPPPRSKIRVIAIYALLGLAVFLGSVAFMARHELMAYLHSHAAARPPAAVAPHPPHQP